jgi:integrase
VRLLCDASERLRPPPSAPDAPRTFASIAIAAGVNTNGLSAYLGHSSIQTTFDRYGHLMPGSEDVAAGLIDAYLSGAGAGA